MCDLNDRALHVEKIAAKGVEDHFSAEAAGNDERIDNGILKNLNALNFTYRFIGVGHSVATCICSSATHISAPPFGKKDSPRTECYPFHFGKRSAENNDCFRL